MTFPATAIKVMIASPGDVSAEREAIRDVIAEWNCVHAEERGQVLLPVGWDTHASPEMGDRPQAIINKQVLANCDLLVAVFWTRLGSSTGKFSSGTVEEIEEHVAAGKVAMIYFSKAPVLPDSIDPEQYAAVKEFKKYCRSKGLYFEYDATPSFPKLFARNLTQKIIEKFPPQRSLQPTPAPADSAPLLSIEARTLLLAAAQDPARIVKLVGTLAGTTIETNGIALASDNEPAEFALWEEGIGQLVEAEALDPEDRATFKVTSTGHKLAHQIRSEGLSDVDRIINQLDDQERNYLLNCSRPRNSDGICLSFIEHAPARARAKYMGILGKCHSLDLLDFDGQRYSMTDMGFKVTDSMWRIAILKILGEHKGIDFLVSEEIAGAVRLVDGESESSELQKFLKELWRENLIEIASVDSRIGGARLTPQGRSYLRNYATIIIDTSESS